MFTDVLRAELVCIADSLEWVLFLLTNYLMFSIARKK